MKIYLASSWRNTHQATVLADLRAAGHEVYDFRNPAPGNTGFGWRQTLDRPIATCADLLEALRHPAAVAGFGYDFTAMKWADACVLLLPCGNSAHLEAGWFSGRGKPVAVLVPELREPELMYKCFDDDLATATPLFEHMPDLLEHLVKTERDLHMRAMRGVGMIGTLVGKALGSLFGVHTGARVPTECTPMPPDYHGSPIDWHRGHECLLDDRNPRSPDVAAEMAKRWPGR